MGKPKVVQPGKQTKMPKDYPVDKYPYMAKKPWGEPEYFQSHKAAVARLREQVFSLQDQFKHLSEDIRQNCTAIVADLGKIPQDGGVVDRLVDPHTGVRYRVELVRRESAL
jgi:hypothetical protein